MSKGKGIKWKENEATRWKLQENIGLGDCFERNLKTLTLVIHI